jgi:hypothetical protein
MIATHPITSSRLTGQTQMVRGELVFSEQTIDTIFTAADIGVQHKNLLFDPHRVHMRLHFKGEEVLPESVGYNESFGEWTEGLGFEIQLTPAMENCILCQHTIVIKG